jgi:hypothetical protein
MLRNIRHFLFFSLTHLIFSISTYATEFYDLNNEVIKEFNGQGQATLSCAKHARMLAEDFPLLEGFKKQTETLIARENTFRQQCSIAQTTNVAQYCVYGVYNDNTTRVVESYDPRSCKGRFYLSGNEPVSLSKGNPHNEGSTIDVQRVGQEKSFVEVRQRLQPLLATIEDTVRFLGQIEAYVQNSSTEAQELKSSALSKKQQLDEFKRKKDETVQELTSIAQQKMASANAEGVSLLAKSVDHFTLSIVDELISALRNNNFRFHGLGETKKKNMKDFINAIHSMLAERKIDELLNSKFFNLGCSEPFLLFDISDEINQNRLIQSIKQGLGKEGLDELIFQLHSTKTPCKSCIICCCGHYINKEGIIFSFFNSIREKLNKPDLPIHFIISYHESYKEGYPFQIPVLHSWPEVQDSILLVNAQQFDEKLVAKRQAIIAEERYRIAKKMMTFGIDSDIIKNILEFTDEDIFHL